VADVRETGLAHWLATQREIALLMAHDLRNPLAAILANLNFLEIAAPSQDGDVLEAIADMKLSAEMLLRLIDNIVTVARLEAVVAVERDETTTVDVGVAARAAFDRARPAADVAGVLLEFTPPPPGERALVQGDAQILEQMVENLVGNVSQHVRRGQRASLAVTLEPSRVVLRLDDEGPPFGDVARDFGREGQIELKKRSDSRYSRGLALYVVGLGARAMGGTITAGSGDGRGHLAIALPRAAE
jgi:signal transduction histidine kinase